MYEIIDDKGRVLLPWSYCEQLNLAPYEPVKIELRLHEIAISKKFWSCIFCKSAINLVRIGKLCACKRCIARLYYADIGDVLEEKPVD